MTAEATATVGRIIAYFEFRRGTAARDMADTEAGLTRVQATSRRLSDTVTQGNGVLTRAGATMGSLTAETNRLRAAQLSAAAAQARVNVVTAAGTTAQERLRASQTQLSAAQARVNGLRVSGMGTAEELTAAETALTDAQRRYTASTVQAQAATGRLASSQAGLIRAQERLAATRMPADPGGLVRLRTSALGAVEMMGKLGLTIGGFVLAMKAIEQIKAGPAFQRQMLMIQTNAGASTEEVRKMSAEVLGLAGPVGTAPTTLATSLYHVEQNGLRGAKALDVVKIAAQGAQVGNAELEATTNSMTAAVVSGIPGVQNMSQAMGALITIVGTGDMKMSDLNEALGSGILAVSKGYGLSLQDVGAALAVFGDNNIRGADAATALRQTIMAFAKPAATAKKDFAEIGLSTKALGRDMATGGLNKAVQDLNSHMIAAGITGNKVGAFLTDAFGKKAGVGLAVLMGQVDRFNNKQEEIARGSGAFADKWAASTHTAAFAFKQIGAEAESAGIVVYNKLQPALYAAGKWLGSDLPAAISSTNRALHPLEQELGAVLVPTFKLLGATVQVVARFLGDVGSVASHHTGTLQVLGTVVLGMWAAWKGYTIAATAVRAVSAAIDIMAVKAYRGAAAVSSVVSGASSLSATSVALGGIGVALGIAAYAWQQHQRAVAADKQAVKDFTQAIQEDNGAVAEHSRTLVINTLQQSGAFDAARQFGLNLADVTDAAMGNSAALGKVNGVLNDWQQSSIDAGAAADNVTSGADNGSDAFGKLRGAIDGTNSQINKAVKANQNAAEANRQSVKTTADQVNEQIKLTQATQYTVDAQGNLVQSQQVVAVAADGTTQSLQQQKTAADLLKQSWDALNGIALGIEQSQNTFLDSLDALTTSVKQNGQSLDQHSAAGRKNREQLVSIIEAAKAAAQAIADKAAADGNMTAGLNAGNAALKANEDRIRGQAANLHLSKAATDALIKSLGQISEVHPISTPKVNTAQAMAGANALQRRLDSLHGDPITVRANTAAAILAIRQVLDYAANHDAVIHVTTTTAGHGTFGGKANAGGGVPDGWSTVGEQGWEAVHKQGNNVQVFSHGDSTKLIPQGPSVPAFASGTKAPKPVMQTIVATAGGGAAYGIANYIKGQIPSVRQATSLLAAAVNDAFQIKGIQNQIASIKTDLDNLRQAKAAFSGTVTSALTGQVDVTKYGDIGMLVGALSSGVGSNQKFTGQEKKLAAEHLPPGLIEALTANGPNAGLDTIAGLSANDPQLKQLSAQYQAFTASAARGGSVAGSILYDPRINADKARIAADNAKITRLAATVDKLVAALARETKQTVEIKAGTEVMARAVIKTHAFHGVIDGLTGHLVYG